MSIYIYMRVYVYIYNIIILFICCSFFTNYTSNFPTSRIIQSVSSQADVGFASSSFFWGYARYSDWIAIELQGVRCFDVELLNGMLCHSWCFLHVVSISWCLWVWAWNNYAHNYYYASPSSFQMLTQLPGAMLIQNVLLGSIPPLGHTFGTKGWAAIFVGTLQTSSAVTTCSWGNFGLIQCQNVRTRRVTEWKSSSHHLRDSYYLLHCPSVA